MTYCNKFKVDTVSYGVKYNDRSIAFQFGVSSDSIQEWRSNKPLLKNSREKKKTTCKATRQRLNEELSQWVVNGLRSNHRPALRQISMKGLKIWTRMGMKKFIPSSDWALRFLQRVNLREMWQRELQKEDVGMFRTVTIGDQDLELRFNEELSQWVVERLESGRHTTLSQISLEGLRLATRLGRKKFLPSSAWAHCFLKRVNLRSMWKSHVQKEKKVSIKDIIEKQFNEKLSGWVVARMERGRRPTLLEISLKGLEFATRLGRKKFNASAHWGYSFLQRVNLSQMWKTDLEKEKSATAETDTEPVLNDTLPMIDEDVMQCDFTPTLKDTSHAINGDVMQKVMKCDGSHAARLKVRAHRLLFEWLSQKLDEGVRPTQDQISSKGVEIETGLGMKKRNAFRAWGRKFLIKSGLQGKWNELRRKENKMKMQLKRDKEVANAKPTPNDTIPTKGEVIADCDSAVTDTERTFPANDEKFMEEAMKYAELHGNRVAAITFGIPEKSFYEYLMRLSQENQSSTEDDCIEIL